MFLEIQMVEHKDFSGNLLSHAVCDLIQSIIKKIYYQLAIFRCHDVGVLCDLSNKAAHFANSEQHWLMPIGATQVEGQK